MWRGARPAAGPTAGGDQGAYLPGRAGNGSKGATVDSADRSSHSAPPPRRAAVSTRAGRDLRDVTAGAAVGLSALAPQRVLGMPNRVRPQQPGPAVISTLLALAGVRNGAVVLDLTPGSSLARAAGAAAGRSGVVICGRAPGLIDGLPAALRGGVVTNAFAALPGSRLLTGLRPLLRAGARVAVTAVARDALSEACTVAAYDLLHAEDDVDGLVVAALRARLPS